MKYSDGFDFEISECNLDQRLFAILTRLDVCDSEPWVAGTRVAVRTLAALIRKGKQRRTLPMLLTLSSGR